MEIIPPSRDDKGRFPRGVSDNPAGRRAMPPEVMEALQAGSERAAKRLVELVESEDPRVAAMAATAVLDRLYGKPTLAVEADVKTTSIQQEHLRILQELQHRRAHRLASDGAAPTGS